MVRVHLFIAIISVHRPYAMGVCALEAVLSDIMPLPSEEGTGTPYTIYAGRDTGSGRFGTGNRID